MVGTDYCSHSPALSDGSSHITCPRSQILSGKVSIIHLLLFHVKKQRLYCLLMFLFIRHYHFINHKDTTYHTNYFLALRFYSILLILIEIK